MIVGNNKIKKKVTYALVMLLIYLSFFIKVRVNPAIRPRIVANIGSEKNLILNFLK